MLCHDILEVIKNTPRELELILKVTSLLSDHLAVDKVNFLIADEKTDSLMAAENEWLIPIETENGRVRSALQIIQQGGKAKLPLEVRQELEVVGHLLALTLENKSFEDQVIVDRLTKLYNRFYLDKCLAYEIERSKRYRDTFSLLLLELDKFKSFNDAYGKPAGDRVLGILAKVLRGNTKATDLVFRFDESKFAVIALRADENGVAVLAERLKKRVEAVVPMNEALLKMMGVRDSSDGQRPSFISVITGSSSYLGKEKDWTASQMIKAADEALFRAKNIGEVFTSLMATRSPLKVLVVDDEQAFCELLAGYFKEKGFDVTHTGSGQKALELLNKEKYDVMILDIRMPGVSGLDVLERIPRQIKKMKVVVLSAVHDEAIKKMAYDYGVCDYLEKPISMESLSQKLMIRILEMQSAKG